jgi:hypothetical protein
VPSNIFFWYACFGLKLTVFLLLLQTQICSLHSRDFLPTMLLFYAVFHNEPKSTPNLSNSQRGGNKRGRCARVPELINAEEGINVEEVLVHNWNKRGG